MNISATNTVGAASAASGAASAGFSGFLTSNQVLIGLAISFGSFLVYLTFSILNYLELRKNNKEDKD